MKIVTKRLKMQHGERFILCDHCNTSFVANYDEAFDKLQDTTSTMKPLMTIHSSALAAEHISMCSG